MVAVIGSIIGCIIALFMILSFVVIYVAVYAVWLFNFLTSIMVYIYPLFSLAHYLICFFMNKAGLFNKYEGKRKYILIGVKVFLIFMAVTYLILFTTSLGYLLFLKYDTSMLMQ